MAFTVKTILGKSIIQKPATAVTLLVLSTCLAVLMFFPNTAHAAPQDNRSNGGNVERTVVEEPGQTGAASSEDGKKTVLDQSKPELPETVTFFQTLMALSFVLGLIFLSAYLYKKLTGIKTGNIRSGRVSINPVGNLALGEKKFLSVVEIQGKYYFIGITPNSINMLSQLDLVLPDEPEGDGPGDFGSIFRKARNLLQHGGSGQGRGTVKMGIEDFPR